MPWKPTNPNKTKPHREKTATRGYGGKWQRLRKLYIKAHPICVECGKPAEVVDHIIPHRNDPELMWNDDNWQSLCKRCHDHKTGTHDSKPTYEYKFRRS